MSGTEQHLDCLLQRERQKNEELKQRNAMLQAQNDAWQEAYERLAKNLVALHDKNKRAE